LPKFAASPEPSLAKIPATFEFEMPVENTRVPVVADVSDSPAANPVTVPVSCGNGAYWKE
jgi:hypothetical protein